MIRSMTGFARKERQGVWGTLSCELRTVNHRYLEVALRLPDELKSVEGEVRQQLGATLRRGKVDANLYLKSAAGSAAAMEVNMELVSQLVRQAKGVGKLLDSPAPISALEVMRWPGVIREAEKDTGPVLAAAQALVREALQELNDTRAREGARMREVILQRCSALKSLVDAVKQRLPETSARLRARVIEKVAQLGQTIDPNRLEQEIVLYTHKMDVDEELDRLQSHLAEITTALDSSDPAGRRLDFLMQELNREANTLSSKSQDVETTKAAVDMKVIIEQIREQIQNIE
jgi:uncharacterized protein (TIGR00255 family)